MRGGFRQSWNTQRRVSLQGGWRERWRGHGAAAAYAERSALGHGLGGCSATRLKSQRHNEIRAYLTWWQ